MDRPLPRRAFLGQSALGGGVLLAGYHLGSAVATESNSALERLNFASVGSAFRGNRNMEGVSGENIVAIADIDANFLEQAGQKERHSRARLYRDYRVMLEKEAPNIDAVLVSCPDHSHAPAAAMAMKLGKHVYCEKPLTHTVYEARVLARLARENDVRTQMGNQNHSGENYRQAVELIQGGAIGDVGEVHVWVDEKYTGRRLTTGNPVPAHVDWDLWLGPTPSRRYCECIKEDGSIIGVHRFNWRWFWDYGTGGIGDFGCHYMDLPFWALNLQETHPTKISATGPRPLAESTTSPLVVTYEFPSRGDQPPVTMTWYDGGNRPEMLSELVDHQGKPLNWKNGHLFVGSRGMLLSDYSRHVLLPADQFVDFERPEPTIPRSPGHYKEWMHAIRNGGRAGCDFAYAGPLTETVLLGVVAYRSGETIEWDGENLQVTNSSWGQQWIHKEYRAGWSL